MDTRVLELSTEAPETLRRAQAYTSTSVIRMYVVLGFRKQLLGDL